MSTGLVLGNGDLTLKELFQWIEAGQPPASLSPDGAGRIEYCRAYLENRLATRDEALYGINTGFGSLCKVRIAPDDLSTLQHNLLRSHACGLGHGVPAPIVRLMMVLKVHALAAGHSGIRQQTVQRLMTFIHSGLLPVVPQWGSLGASGDLAPLAHLCLPLIGEGEVQDADGYQLAPREVMAIVGRPLELGAKEGLALLNGTQLMAAYGVWCAHQAEKLCRVAHLVAALTTDAWHGRTDAFHPAIHHIRGQHGQITSAGWMRQILSGSPVSAAPKTQVQDPYAIRCIPQVHGAVMDALSYASKIIERECNAVTDNPLIFPHEDLIVSGGNFHGEPIALALDHLCLALHELGSISERRTFNLLSGTRGLPDFLSPQPGLNSGLMIPQYSAAALLSRNRLLTAPASADSITSSNGQEDHVSMGAHAAVKCAEVIENLWSILGIEWLSAAQAISIRGEQTSPLLQQLLSNYHELVPPMNHDRYLKPDMEGAAGFLRALELEEDPLRQLNP